MRWLQFTANTQTSWGILEADRVIAVSGDPFGEWQRTARTYSLADVKIELPVMPRTFYCVGLNYLKHLKEAADKRGEVPNVPDRPEIGYRAQNALIAHDEDVVIPASATEKIHYEGELVVVIGKKAKHLSEADAMSCVFGYTIGNDVSERTWQKADRGLWRAKNVDTFKPMGPWIETSVDLEKMETIVKVNGNESNQAVHRRVDEVFHAIARRCDLDGNRRRLPRSEGRRRGRGRNHRYRYVAQSIYQRADSGKQEGMNRHTTARHGAMPVPVGPESPHSAACGISCICSCRMTPESGSNSPIHGERSSTALVWA